MLSFFKVSPTQIAVICLSPCTSLETISQLVICTSVDILCQHNIIYYRDLNHQVSKYIKFLQAVNGAGPGKPAEKDFATGPPPGDPKTKTGLIVGCVLGGICLLGLLVFGGVVFHKRKHKKQAKSQSSPDTVDHIPLDTTAVKTEVHDTYSSDL